MGVFDSLLILGVIVLVFHLFSGGEVIVKAPKFLGDLYVFFFSNCGRGEKNSLTVSERDSLNFALLNFVVGFSSISVKGG